ncbi:MAG: GTPase Era [Firmicutes bacterium]|nr:GTPase Era [Bacillota bacterium]MCL5971787.1 GTPase Era [Bacillota bacterium]
MSYHSGFVALVGRPNVGKSTLLNAVLDRKIAITAAKPQTTRNRIQGILHRENAQLILVDTPGVHKAHNLLGHRMVKTSKRAVGDVDLIWHIVDISKPPREEDQWVADMCQKTGIPTWLVGNKSDLVLNVVGREDPYLALMDYCGTFIVSATKEIGIQPLLDQTMARLPEGNPYFPPDMVTDQTEDFYIGEIIREKVLELTQDEIPHSLAVVVDEKAERPRQVMYIRATLFVERATQKAIIIGQHGQMLRQIGQESRKELEAYYDRRVFLDLWVKIRPHWRGQDQWLSRLGYQDPEKT